MVNALAKLPKGRIIPCGRWGTIYGFPTQLLIPLVQVGLDPNNFNLGTRIPPVLADTTSRPACHALRRRTHGERSKGLTRTENTHAQKKRKYMTDNQQSNLKEPSHSLHYTTQRMHARLFLERGAVFLPSFPRPSGEY